MDIGNGNASLNVKIYFNVEFTEILTWINVRTQSLRYFTAVIAKVWNYFVEEKCDEEDVKIKIMGGSKLKGFGTLWSM